MLPAELHESCMQYVGWTAVLEIAVFYLGIMQYTAQLRQAKEDKGGKGEEYFPSGAP